MFNVPFLVTRLVYLYMSAKIAYLSLLCSIPYVGCDLESVPFPGLLIAIQNKKDPSFAINILRHFYAKNSIITELVFKLMLSIYLVNITFHTTVNDIY